MDFIKLSKLLVPTLFIALFSLIPINNNHNDIEPWMKNVSDDTRLIDMSIPGSHDSGATHSIFDVAGKCQDLSIEEQLKIGTRFFDLRLQLVKDEFRIIHGPVDQNLKFKDVLNSLVNYIEKYNSEFIIISIKQEDSSIDSLKSFEEVLTSNLKEHESFISFNKSFPETIKTLRGKIHIISRYNLDYGYPAYYGWSDDTSFTLDNLYVQDNYCIDETSEKKQDIINCFNISNDSGNDKIVLNFTSCYLDNAFPPTYAGTAANDINPWLLDYVKNNQNTKLGIVIMDFVSEELSKEIYRRNY